MCEAEDRRCPDLRWHVYEPTRGRRRSGARGLWRRCGSDRGCAALIRSSPSPPIHSTRPRPGRGRPGACRSPPARSRLRPALFTAKRFDPDGAAADRRITAHPDVVEAMIAHSPPNSAPRLLGRSFPAGPIDSLPPRLRSEGPPGAGVVFVGGTMSHGSRRSAVWINDRLGAPVDGFAPPPRQSKPKPSPRSPRPFGAARCGHS